MESDASTPMTSSQQQLMEYRLRKKREAQVNANKSQPTPSRTTAIPITEENKNDYVKTPIEDTKTSYNEDSKQNLKDEDEKLLWKQKQEEYKRMLMSGNTKPVKYKVFDFTQGSENQQKLATKNFDFASTEVVPEPKYRKEDITTLYTSIGKTEVEIVENAREEAKALRPQALDSEEEKEESKNNNEARPNGPLIPLLRNQEEINTTRDFLCLRNVNRDAVGLILIFSLLAATIGLLFALSAI